VVDVGSKYRLRVFMHGPVSLADMARKVTARVEEVSWGGGGGSNSSAWSVMNYIACGLGHSCPQWPSG
jgi:hypothetical protein